MRLFELLARASANAVAICLMPDHFHVFGRVDVHEALGRSMQAFAQWRNHRRGEAGSVWERQPRVDFVRPGVKSRRVGRYVHLNPCRAGIVGSPLAWPLSTYRDLVGLSARPIRAASPAPEREHSYAKHDDRVSDRAGLPRGGRLSLAGERALSLIEAAVSEVLRLPVVALRGRGPARRLAICAAREHTRLSVTVIARHFGVSRQAVYGAPVADSRGVALVERVAGAARFPGLRVEDARLRRRSGPRESAIAAPRVPGGTAGSPEVEIADGRVARN